MPRSFDQLAVCLHSPLLLGRCTTRATPPRPDQWLLMGVQAYRMPALRRLKRLKPLKPCKSFSDRNAQPRMQKLPQGQIHAFFWVFKPAVCQPERVKRCKNLLERPTAQTKATPQGQINGFLWAFKRAVCHINGLYASSRSQQAPHGHINGFLWASKPAVCQPLNA